MIGGAVQHPHQSAVENLLPTLRMPTLPGAMLFEEFLEPFAISQRDLADSIHVPYQRVNELVNGRRGALAAVVSSGAS